MDEARSRRALLSRLGGSVAITVSVGGCLGDDDGTTGDGEPQPAPAEFPAGLGAESVDLEVLRETVESIITEESFTYEGFGEQLNLGSEQRKVRAIRVTADTTAERGFIIRGERVGQLDDPLNAPLVEIFYAEGEQAYDVKDLGTPEPVDGDFERVIATTTDHLELVLDHVTDVTWGSPRWAPERGVYVIDGADIDPQSSVVGATLQVNADGVPVGLNGQIDRAAGRIDVDISFMPNVEVSRPEWVEEAF